MHKFVAVLHGTTIGAVLAGAMLLITTCLIMRFGVNGEVVLPAKILFAVFAVVFVAAHVLSFHSRMRFAGDVLTTLTELNAHECAKDHLRAHWRDIYVRHIEQDRDIMFDYHKQRSIAEHKFNCVRDRYVHIGLIEEHECTFDDFLQNNLRLRSGATF